MFLGGVVHVGHDQAEHPHIKDDQATKPGNQDKEREMAVSNNLFSKIRFTRLITLT